VSYSLTYFQNNPEIAKSPGVLYVVVLVNKKTFERECLKIGITKGKSWKDAIKRSKGFDGYEIRIQKIVESTLEEVYFLEQYLHEKYSAFRHTPKLSFGGKTECFEISILKNVLEYIKEQKCG
jgi:hypothetical protein